MVLAERNDVFSIFLLYENLILFEYKPLSYKHRNSLPAKIIRQFLPDIEFKLVLLLFNMYLVIVLDRFDS